MQRFLLLCLLMLLSGCLARSGVRVASGVRLQLLSPASLGRPFAVLHRWVGKFGKRKVSFLAQVEIDAAKIVMVGLTPVGGPFVCFNLRWEKNYLSATAVF